MVVCVVYAYNLTKGVLKVILSCEFFTFNTKLSLMAMLASNDFTAAK